MSEEERLLRLENAMSTLAELAAEQQRQTAEQQRQTSEQQRLSAEQQRRTARLEESFVMLVELTRSHDESLDGLKAGQDELRAAQAETEHKIAALVDAQIRSEEAHGRAMTELRAAQSESNNNMSELRAAQSESNNNMSELRAAQSDSSNKIAALADAMKLLAEAQRQLAESQAHSDQRLDALIDFVREQRNGRG